MEKGSTAPIICRLLFTLTAVSAVSPAMAQQGSMHITYAPFDLPNMTERGGVATFSPIDTIDGKTIQLRSDDGKTFTFALNAKSVYCQGNKKAMNWTYLKKMIGQKTSITVMTNQGVDYALVVWDQGPKTTKDQVFLQILIFRRCVNSGFEVKRWVTPHYLAPALFGYPLTVNSVTSLSGTLLHA